MFSRVRPQPVEPPDDGFDTDYWVFETFEVNSGIGFEPLESYTKGGGTL